MWATRIIPTLLLQGEGLYKTIRFNAPRYLGDPLNAIRIFNEKEVDELLLIDITATQEGRGPRFDYLRDAASECFMPLCYGGGITSLAEMERLFRVGMEKVSLNTAAFEKPTLVAAAVREFGSQSVVAAIDVGWGSGNRRPAFVRRGRKRVADDVVSAARYMASLGVGEILLNDIARDGTMQGYDLALIEEVASAVEVPVIALGGAGRFEDFEAAVASGASAVAAGSFFVFYGRHRAVLITYPEPDQVARLVARKDV